MKLRNKKTGGDNRPRYSKGKVIEGSFVKEEEAKTVEPTVYGFELKHVEMARMLLEESITLHELKEHMHDFEWIADIIRKDLEKQMQSTVSSIMKGVK